MTCEFPDGIFFLWLRYLHIFEGWWHDLAILPAIASIDTDKLWRLKTHSSNWFEGSDILTLVDTPTQNSRFHLCWHFAFWHSEGCLWQLSWLASITKTALPKEGVCPCLLVIIFKSFAVATVNIPHVRSGLTLDNQVKVLPQTNLPILFWNFNLAPLLLPWASVLPWQTLN